MSTRRSATFFSYDLLEVQFTEDFILKIFSSLQHPLIPGDPLLDRIQ
jgi:hypothetical protein